MLAVRSFYGEDEIYLLLLKYSTDPHTRDKKGRNSFGLAENVGRLEKFSSIVAYEEKRLNKGLVNYPCVSENEDVEEEDGVYPIYTGPS